MLIGALGAFALLGVTSALAQGVDTSTPMLEIHGEVCDPPFAGACPRGAEAPSCRVLRTATSRDGRVTAEIVADGGPMDLQAIHLVVRRSGRAWARREIGHAGVGCGTFELYAVSCSIEELRVADVLEDAAPEVVVRYRGGSPGSPAGFDSLLLCSTTDAPRCVARPVTRSRLRFRRPDVVLSGREHYRVDLAR